MEFHVITHQLRWRQARGELITIKNMVVEVIKSIIFELKRDYI